MNGTLSALVISEIKARMGRDDVTRVQLARQIGRSHTWVGERLQGRTNITLDDLEVIAQGLGVDWWELLPHRAGAERRTNNSSVAQPGRTTSERLMAAQIHAGGVHRSPAAEPVPATNRTGVRRPRVKAYTHAGVTAR